VEEDQTEAARAERENNQEIMIGQGQDKQLNGLEEDALIQNKT
jgi:hypothetical protein